VTITLGSRLGPYEILSALGAGGMGEVYRAKDTKLHRDVAIKVLPDLFATDPDRLARFQREAQVLASLNHPNIAAIHGLEETDGVKALVLELVEGPTLADRIAQGPIPLDEALPIARQIAEALEAAHEQGIIHRDLKPANIKLRPDGTVKVLDFGLAKALDPATGASDLSQSPTNTSPAMTRTRKTWFRSTNSRVIPYKKVTFTELALREIVLGASSPMQEDEQALAVLMENTLGKTLIVSRSPVLVRP
jgi:serine/threonine protein kinase